MHLRIEKPDTVFPWGKWNEITHTGCLNQDAAMRYCLSMAKKHYENFPVFFSLMNKNQQKATSAIYAFARTADDFADESEFEGNRLEMLDMWEKQLLSCYNNGITTNPVFIALKVQRAFLILSREFLFNNLKIGGHNNPVLSLYSI